LFPEESGGQIRLNLASNLRAIISQRLVPTVDGSLTVVLELMLNEGLVRDLIAEGKISKIREVMEANQASGMITFDQSLMALFERGIITEETAISQSDMPGDMRMKILKVRLGGQSDAFRDMDTSILKISE
jgi:twitching motility protein PilU